MALFLRTPTAGGVVAVSLVASHAAVTAEAELGEPPARTHAHDDHDRPLPDALEHGFTSVEADVLQSGDPGRCGGAAGRAPGVHHPRSGRPAHGPCRSRGLAISSC